MKLVHILAHIPGSFSDWHAYCDPNGILYRPIFRRPYMERGKKLYLTILTISLKKRCQKPRKLHLHAVAINMSAEELTASFNLNLDFRLDVPESGGDIL